MKRDDLIYPELSYKVVGILYNVYNEVGYGHKEKFYQNALSIAFEQAKINFKEQVYAPLKFRGSNIGRYYFDFLIENKIVLEIKKDPIFRSKNIEQIYSYLIVNNLKLGILANFSKDRVVTKRIVNIS